MIYITLNGEKFRTFSEDKKTVSGIVVWYRENNKIEKALVHFYWGAYFISDEGEIRAEEKAYLEDGAKKYKWFPTRQKARDYYFDRIVINKEDKFANIKVGDKFLIREKVYTLTFVGEFGNDYRLVGDEGLCWSCVCNDIKKIKKELIEQKAVKLDKLLSRIEYISKEGREFVKYFNKEVYFSWQDNGATLKIIEK